jgi:hypothetical protein
VYRKIWYGLWYLKALVIMFILLICMQFLEFEIYEGGPTAYEVVRDC